MNRDTNGLYLEERSSEMAFDYPATSKCMHEFMMLRDPKTRS
jgi:hypothetical protein